MDQESALPKVVMGFDFGTKKIGVAIGQTVTKSARALATIPAKEGIPNWQILDSLIKKWRPNAFVVGIPLNMDGTPQAVSAKAQAFAELLRSRYQLHVYEMDERLTTKAAKEQLFNEGGFKALQDGQVDRVAAQLILQNWFVESGF